MNIIKKTYDGLKGLLSGMALTFSYFIRFDKVITQQYPENRDKLKLPPRSRSRIELIYDEQSGNFKCIACGLCVRACPNNSIEVIRGKDPQTQKPKLEKFVYHFERCVVCGLCVEACKSDALTMGNKFENAVYDSSQLTIILNQIPDSLKKKSETKPQVVVSQSADETKIAAEPKSQQINNSELNTQQVNSSLKVQK
ncbi:MAG: NuoI/complex I 23 kDa subunit family protein [Limisphaerales bacterium]|jgi:NADH-quinone oxidoreductase subunit I